jgi:hypothetical protein
MRQVIELGDVVLCDLCNRDYTYDDKSTGGFQFVSRAVCPRCEPSFRKQVEQHNEVRYITNWARPDETFRDFVYRLRGGESAQIIIESFP